MRLSEVSKATQAEKLQRKKRDAQIGLANNAFGAAAGAAATSAVYAQQRKTLRAAKKPPVDEWAASYPTLPKTKAPKPTRTERVLRRIKVKPKYVLPAVAATAVGSQVINGAMDAQSAAYFGRELKDIRAKEAKVGKNDASIISGVVRAPRPDGYGRNLNLEPVAKKARRFDAEADRQRRLGVYEGAGAAGAAGLTTSGAVRGYLKWKRQSPADRALMAAKLKGASGPAALLAGGAGSATLAVAAHRRAATARNERWT